MPDDDLFFEKESCDQSKLLSVSPLGTGLPFLTGAATRFF